MHEVDNALIRARRGSAVVVAYIQQSRKVQKQQYQRRDGGLHAGEEVCL